jgi:hypothetical protein
VALIRLNGEEERLGRNCVVVSRIRDMERISDYLADGLWLNFL